MNLCKNNGLIKGSLIVLVTIVTNLNLAHASNDNPLAKALSNNINDNYISEDKLPAINKALAEVFNQNSNDKLPPEDLADALSKGLKKIDEHFGVQYLTQYEKTSNKLRESWGDKLRRKNLGFTRLEILSGNVGVMEFSGFVDLNSESKQHIKSIMNFFEGVDALIIDLRSNGGGSGETVAWLSSYFVKGKVHLNSFYTRSTGYYQRMWTSAKISNKHFEDLPLYVLTGPDTFSAAEEFAYNFKHMKRATIVGETSKGGANPWQWFSLPDGFRIGIPTTEAINPITKSNWEGVGVLPDIPTNTENALDTAYKMALDHIRPNVKNPYQLKEIEAVLTNNKDD